MFNQGEDQVAVIEKKMQKSFRAVSEITAEKTFMRPSHFCLIEIKANYQNSSWLKVINAIMITHKL